MDYKKYGIPIVFIKWDGGWIQTHPYHLKLWIDHNNTLKGDLCMVGIDIHIDRSEIFIETEKIQLIQVTRRSGTTHKDKLGRDIPDFEDIIVYQRQDPVKCPHLRNIQWCMFDDCKIDGNCMKEICEIYKELEDH